MKLRIPRVAVFALLLGVGGGLIAPSIGHAADPLTLEDVLRLHIGGLSDDIIASEILVTETVFDLSPSDLLRLKDAGLSEELIRFMVETGLDQQADAESDPSDQDAMDAGEEEEAYAEGGWLNVIEEEPATTTFVTLDYDYPVWWYDFYWADYWYYDHHYYPYNYSYSWVYGAWYPTWFSYRYCYLPPYWGYRSHYYGHYGYDWTYAHCDSYYAGGGYYTADTYHTRPLSRTKYKTGGSSGKILYADVGLKVRDVGRLTKTATRADRPNVRLPIKDRLLVADGRSPLSGGDRVRRPIKSTGLPERPSTGLGKPLDTRRVSASAVPDKRRTLTRTTRRPVLDNPPKVQVRTVDRPRTPVRTPTPSVEKPRGVEKPRTNSNGDAGHPQVKPPPPTKPKRPAADATRTRPKPTKPTPPPESPRAEVKPAPTPPPAPPQREPPRAAPARPAPKSPPQAAPKARAQQPKPKGRTRTR